MMRFAQCARSLCFVLLSYAVAAEARTPNVPPDGSVSGTLTLDGKAIKLTHVYARKREAWPADAKLLSAKSADNLSCGIVDVILTNEGLTEPAIAAILQGDYHGSPKTRGVRFVIDGAGTYKWETLFLLESGIVKGYGMTQSSGWIKAGPRYSGKIELRNEDVTKVRVVDLTFNTSVKVQYAHSETESVEAIPENRIADAFVTMLPGEWKVERWLGLSCTTATGTLVVGERTNPHTFKGTFHLTLSSGKDVDEEMTISLTGTKVHFEGGDVSVPENVWTRDVMDLDLRQNLMIGNNATDFVVLRKSSAQPATLRVK